MFILAGSSSIDLLNVSPGLSFWTFITFLIVLLVLWRFAWKPIIQALDTRNQKVVDDLEKSEQLRQEAESLLTQYQTELKEARCESIKLIEKATSEAEEERAKILEQAKVESEEFKKQVKREIELARAQMAQELEAKMVSLTIKIISSLMDEKISDDQHKEFILKKLQEFGNVS